MLEIKSKHVPRSTSCGAVVKNDAFAPFWPRGIKSHARPPRIIKDESIFGANKAQRGHIKGHTHAHTHTCGRVRNQKGQKSLATAHDRGARRQKVDASLSNWESQQPLICL
jgi:hypothetical protein